MLDNVTFLLAAVPAVLIAGISKGGFGSGASFVSVTILALVLPPAAALGLMLPLLIVMDLTSLRPYWKRWSNRDAVILILASVPGIVIGAALLSRASPDVVRLLIGGISIAFVAYQLWPRRAQREDKPWPVWVGVLAGAVAGFTSFISHAGGPVTAVYLLRQKLDKTTYQATTVIVFFAINLLKLGFYAGLGLFSLSAVADIALLAPVAIAGTWIGVRAHFLMPERWFFVLTYVLLLATGAKLMFDGLT
ncbi:hypothetical protein PRI8871_00409 [Pseudoprimorskyibacter insulae]|uniref:Probable membrane transporter protein n=1 Tax=Pseudoprimorskyibacter insulae TaxID=1695997 RepID=A0A2R8AP63_9RHOB|nr:hypothetical protein PRI8871_00409 [Pseudoprimorskyibacter insulae]